ncbi:MAG: bifunctional 3,4-dihydroxy-2-butanone 4-phosphate synthase/GTP cyclohydrolase II [Candidatus Raymondbacteria bacterium RifOxyA12_full_50_37]|uniref:Riboflavin biosynthesis protein RibBA n=1 Tax=Candidatus Raymondbacteria bacterium RIFOXYD12_FULL_49_13 TaxID=1817890 RepID=A0A1F7FGT2_UNCRA|nr:MAG: bifunctional 3,4-dihydroxy-2-butanone 4-phosphate synthase/GTP cyclohydrolase II [Candidatus Raymondbacteria bacterium RifOxyB12_full_50_8]OGJ91601.1 MAG: bifunctional 3,4-dihydroxy-2-butanone 4-phosphate synthase/GTP cyclohydrolase II [Candidatus Raymondbacteria bacterium RifOxyA12_full_50_37]OGJ92907.1 MAG: bifunctional 3,4-dihydroxy-2-butanone 4-phosphate synthase/GTP cyclohydrolase II [Candidatus Raymondbacteria bacterium RIFOXYA2_FULL_49_16]OGK05707.1 MAG: bifunctional 3,4-dihydroxy
MKNPFSPVELALREYRRGNIIVITDDEDRENEGDLACAADAITPAKINFMAKYGRGLICTAMAGDLLDRLNLPMMTSNNQSTFGTGFTITVDARTGVSTGISAKDRAHTIKVLIDPKSRAADIVSPGHTFPLRARDGGVLIRAGQTEASVDLARMAGQTPAGVICEIMNADGSMARLPDLAKFVKTHRLAMISIKSLIEYRLRNEKIVKRIAEPDLPTKWGDFKLCAYEEIITGACHFALVKGDIDPRRPVLVRVHSECLTGDILGSLRCDCGPQLDLALQQIGRQGGVLVYLRQEGRGIGFANKMRAYALQDKGLDTVEANVELGFPPDKRDYGIGAQILADLGVCKIRLLTNNPKKIYGLEGYNIEIVERLSIRVTPNKSNKKYLKTKKEKLGHLF